MKNIILAPILAVLTFVSSLASAQQRPFIQVFPGDQPLYAQPIGQCVSVPVGAWTCPATFEQYLFPNVSVLRNASGAMAGQLYVQGTASQNDGGEGFFYWSYTSTIPDDNGVTSIKPTWYGQSAGRWLRLGAIPSDIPSLSGNNIWTGTNTWQNTSTFSGLANFTNTFQIGGVTQNFPASGDIVGTTDTQTLTNKTITGAIINGGTVSGAAISGGTLSGSAITGGTISGLASPIATADGGTGLSSPGTAGNVLTSNGTTWVSQTLSPHTRVVTSSSTIQTSDCGGTVQAGTGTSGFFTITLPSTSGFPAGCAVTVKNGDGWSGRGKSLSGFPADFTNGQLVLWPLQSGSVQIVNGIWTTINRPGRAKLPGGTINFFSNFTSGSDTPGVTDGMASGASAFKALQTAMYMACNEFDFSSVPQSLYTINVAANINDTTGVHYACHGEPGAQGGAAITVSCGTNATLNTTNTDAFAIEVNATVAITGCTFQASGTVPGSNRTADCIRADYGANVFAVGNTFAVCGNADYAADNGGHIVIESNVSVNGNGTYFVYAQSGGTISTDHPPATLTTTFAAGLSFSGAIAFGAQGGSINMPSWQAAGSAPTAIKAATAGAGSIYTGAGTAACNNSYFPGTSNGTVASPFCN